MRISDWSSDVCSSDLLRIADIRRQPCPHVTDQTDLEGPGLVDPFGNAFGLRARAIMPPADHQRDAIGITDLVLHIEAKLRVPLLGKQRVRQHRNRSEEHTSELQSLMRISYAVF